MGKREKSFKRKIERVEQIIRDLSEQKDIPPNTIWNRSLWTRITAKVQLELCMSERKAKEYIKLVRVKAKGL